LIAARLALETHAVPVNPTPTDTLRPEQRGVLKEVVPNLRVGRIVLAELGTGVGKSRVLAYAAAYMLSDRDRGLCPAQVSLPEAQRLRSNDSVFAQSGVDRAQEKIAQREERVAGRAVILVAPTLANVLHLVEEYLAVRDEIDPDRAWRPAVQLGRGQFVCETHLRSLLSEDDTADAGVHAWLDAGMPAKTEATLALHRLCPELRGLADDLRAVATAFPVEEVLLSSDDSEVDQATYCMQREAAQSADLVFTTHALLCADNLALLRENASSALPPALALLVDEAHLLEASQANAATHGVAFSTLRADLRHADHWPGCKTLASEAAAIVDACMKALSAIRSDVVFPLRANVDPDIARRWHAAAPEIQACSTALEQLLAKITKGKRTSRISAQHRRLLTNAVTALRDTLRGDRRGMLRLSTERRYPTLDVGPSNVDSLLAARWSITACALLVSGTLLTPTARVPSPQHMIATAALPVARTVCLPPVRPAWLTRLPTVRLPHAAMNWKGLCPPSSESDDDLWTQWAAAQAGVIATACADASGGMLVLCSGYRRAKGIHGALRGLLGEDRLVLQERDGLTLAMAGAAFRQKHREGLRPIWLGVGGAWTGIDLADRSVPAEEDTLLTDLVITAVPFGLTHTSTHISRVHYRGFIAEKAAALLALRQGVGRLVRRPNVRNRRIWILDGRLCDPQKSAIMSEARLLFEGYDHIEPI
jgi:Rad3-related DNA helicase